MTSALKAKRLASWLAQGVALVLIVAGSPLVWSPAASADPVYGTQSISYSGVANPPTSDKPQSKLWWNDGSWWADMWTTGDGWHIYRLDRGTHSWVDTGLLNDNRGSTLADTLWDGTHLYIASHVVGVSTNYHPVVSVAGQPAYLYRYSYAGGKYTLDPGFPTVITNNSSESMTIDKDSTGAIWATWTQVAGDSTTGYTNTVYVNKSAPGGGSWGAPFIIPVSNPDASPDDISAVVAFGKNKIGVMWSDQLTGSVRWATRTDGTASAASSSWNFQSAIQGNGLADDHLNLKSLQADPTGRVFAAVKTSLNDTSSDPALPELLLLVFKPGTGAFTQATISTAGDCVTRPQIVLDTENNLVHAFQTAPPTSVTGCAYSGVAGTIYEKTASMDNPAFGPGRGTPIIQSASSSNINDLTTTKQSVNKSTGIVVVASDDVAHNYWFSDQPIGPASPAPAASFTAAPTSGAAPLNLSFTDTSTGTPTSWAWDFGDGGTSTTQNPAHSYTTAGTYTAKLTATNGTGTTSATTTITVTAATPVPVPGPGAPVPPAAATDIQAAAAANQGLGTAVSAVTCGMPSGGCYQVYQAGVFYWTAGTGAHATSGAIRGVWGALGFEAGRLGYPVTDLLSYPNGGFAQAFQKGSIYWTASTGAHSTSGAIRWLWGTLGFERGRLGYPTTDELSGYPNGGFAQAFQNGSIYWTASTGAHSTSGAIRTAWAAQGFERGVLGYPVTNELSGYPNGGFAQAFENGSIYWTASTGAHSTSGAIRTAWAAQGFEGGRLGYPTTDLYATPDGGFGQNFQGGSISWTATAGAIVR